jgi:alkanesulfonate monooxygenase SsuD/methylene tetrahydromethanopterin reductase-like flavin-dependent oxidoreductase (luciferase family)
MHVGKGFLCQNLSGERTDSEVLTNELSMASAAEAQGFESIWTPEHHFTGYHMVPNVVQMLSYLAGRTSRALLGSMVVVLPWHEPVRVAEELSVLDSMSGGRLIVGVGRGLGRIEFEGFRIAMSESRGRFTEYARSIVEAFDTGVIQSDGEYYKQRPIALRPAPLASLRGRVYASAVSPESMDIMAALKFGVMVIAQKPWATTEAELKMYKERYLAINGVEPPKPILVSQVVVHDSAEAAREGFEQHIVAYAQSCVDHYEFGNVGLADIPGYEYYGKLAENISKHGTKGYTEFLAGLQVYGTPDQVVEQLVSNVRRIDAAGVVAMLSLGDMPPEDGIRNQELFARRVLPVLHSIDTDRLIDHPALVGGATL